MIQWVMSQKDVDQFQWNSTCTCIGISNQLPGLILPGTKVLTYSEDARASMQIKMAPQRKSTYLLFAKTCYFRQERYVSFTHRLFVCLFPG